VIAERVAGTHSLAIFDLQHRREAYGWVLRIFLDRPDAGASAPPAEPVAGPGDYGVDVGDPGGVSVDDCARVSRDLSAVLDVEDLIDHAYTLEVSSPGLDRPLRAAGDYRRFAGRLAKIVVREPVDNQKYLTGRLRGLDDANAGTVLLEGHGGRIHRIPLSAISRARLDVDF
jgi:ribosome maturation factor RimP